VLPDVAGEQGLLVVLHGQIGVGRRDDLELAGVADEPRPARAEAADGGVDEVFLELVVRAEVARDRLRQLARGRAAALGLHAVPEKGVVPDLGGVIEDGPLARAHDDLFEALVCFGLALEQALQLIDIRLVVFAVMKIERLGAHVRL
jgi:hypothetical protein